MLKANSTELEADFWRYYQKDIRAVWTGEMTFRQAFVLMKHLPDGSALKKKLTGPTSEWSSGEHLLAYILDELRTANFYFICANTDPDAPNPEAPTPVPHPGIDDESERPVTEKVSLEKKTDDEKFASPHEVSAFFAGLNRGGG